MSQVGLGMTCGLWVSEQLAAVPEFQGLGPLFKSSPEPVALTESETEYVIRCTKHTFTNHMVFQVSRGPGTPHPVAASVTSCCLWICDLGPLSPDY